MAEEIKNAEVPEAAPQQAPQQRQVAQTEVVVDESHGFHGCQDPIIELSFIVGQLDAFAFVGPVVKDAFVLSFMQFGRELAHLLLVDLSFAADHVFDEFLCDDVLLAGGEDDFEYVLG